MNEHYINNLKQLSLYIILDAYVTKNAIEDFLSKNHTYNSKKYTENIFNIKLNNYIEYLNKELDEIEEFLNDNNNIHWTNLGTNRNFFDKNLPKYKRKIRLFHSIDRYPFDFNIFFNNKLNNE